MVFWQNKFSVHSYNLHYMRYRQSYSYSIQKHTPEYWAEILFLCIICKPSPLQLHQILAEKKCVLYMRLYGQMVRNSVGFVFDI